MRIERSELEALVAVIEAGGFQRASEGLGRSQSAISQSVAGLESKLDCTLIKRGRSPQLTRSGRRIYQYALQTLSGERQVLAEVAALARTDQPPLSIAMNSFVSRYFASPLLAFCAEQHGDLQLNVRVMPSRQIISAVLAGELELGFGPFQTHMQAFSTLGLLRVQHSLVISKAHPDFDAITLGDDKALAASRLIASYLDEPGDRPGQQRIRDYFDTVWQVNSLALRIDLIARGLGVGYMNAQTLHAERSVLSLHEIDHADFSSFEREVGLFYQKDKVLSCVARDFIDQCKQRWPT